MRQLEPVTNYEGPLLAHGTLSQKVPDQQHFSKFA